ncbi:MAG: SRPBCC domain-containing protein [Gammaproteobacteria bacterium]|nr:SRPBCC domain-containing protein [Gammaproteobacteria bacterium]
MEYSGFPRQDATRVLIMTRVFAATRALVWQAWTDASQAQRWMGPRGFSASHLQSELRPGGAWRACLRRDDDGKALWQGGIYLEVVAPERLAFSFAWDDANQRRGHETRITLSFSEQQGETTLGFRQEMFETVEQRDAHQQGWNSAFDRLAEHLMNIQTP